MTILKGIPRISAFCCCSALPYAPRLTPPLPRAVNPQLLYALARMGHGDELVLADANFPSSSVAKHTTLGEEIRMDGEPLRV